MVNNEFKSSVLSVVKEYMKSSAFTDRKLTDTPLDALSVVSRKYVTLNGATGSRPTASIVGQFYLDTTVGRPLWWNGSAWIDGVGSVH